METKEGESVRSKLDGKLYKVNGVNGEELILESEKGLCQTWFGRWDLELFFEKTETIQIGKSEFDPTDPVRFWAYQGGRKGIS